MGILPRDEDTICAVSTPPGSGGVALIRVSGENALHHSRQVCSFLPTNPESHRVYYGFAVDPHSKERLDEVLATYFAKGRSFTGEETLEISCHGGSVVTGMVLQALIEAGSRLAEKGEFTYRAFLSGRIDLVQAESILSLIEANSKRASRLALRQLDGHLSHFTQQLEDSLHWVVAHLEANIDFAYEDIESASTDELEMRLQEVLKGSRRAVSSYAEGRFIQEGLQIALIGRPNVGKSSLLNALMGEEKSIVSHFPGTTRDQVEGSLIINGIKIHLVDTAGLRETSDFVEKIGIERTMSRMKSADIVWLLVDLKNLDERDESLDFLVELDPLNVWLIGHKSDQVEIARAKEILKSWWMAAKKFIGLSWDQDPKMLLGNSVASNGLDEIHSQLRDFLGVENRQDSVVLVQARHFELFKRITVSLEKGLSLLQNDESPDLVAFELRDALLSLYELRGKQFDDEVLDRVFKEFCLGK